MPDSTSPCDVAAALPAKAGIGLRSVHYQEILATLPSVGWLEVHSENYFGAGGQPLHYLEQIRSHYPLSLHGVGMSIGSTDTLNYRHLDKLKALISRFQPALVSEHLCWSSVAGRHMNDLLPLPYTEEALAHVCRQVDKVQHYLGRRILIENVSSYLEYAASTIPEWEFIAALADKTGCGILLDVNNIHVNAINHAFDPIRYLQAMPKNTVAEIHLAGFDSNGECLIDTHGTPVAPEVWSLYQIAIERFGRIPSLIEWDTDIPTLDILMAEAEKADRILEQAHALAA